MIERLVPILQVKSAEASLQYYRGKLGFREVWRYQSEPGEHLFVAVERDGFRLFLSEFLESVVGGQIYLYVKDVDAVAREFAERGVTFEWAPAETAWGTREFRLRDPDGNKLRFGMRLS
jgi:catechol 2,3-dioxygenase-like lactoylglutathione lyase family enzyme